MTLQGKNYSLHSACSWEPYNIDGAEDCWRHVQSAYDRDMQQHISFQVNTKEGETRLLTRPAPGAKRA